MREPLYTMARWLFATFAATVDTLLPSLPPILLVEDAHSQSKHDEILRRLAFYAPGLDPARVSVVQSISLRHYLSRVPVLLLGTTRWPSLLLRLRQHIYDVDFERSATDAWNWCEFTLLWSGRSRSERVAAAQKRFGDAIAMLHDMRLPKAYIFGTGASLEKAQQQSFADGYRIVCNTIVRDVHLWQHLDPHIIVAADAIYHFSGTAHARAFRKDLLLRLTEPGNRTLFVYPDLFDEVVLREFASVRERLVSIPFGHHQDIHVDLTQRFQLPALGNVLNCMLLPIACTLSKDVRLWGFDGRAPADKHFWSNSSKHSYPELMDALHAEHPAFFAKNVPKEKPEQYVQSVHGDLLDQRLGVAERLGWRFEMMHFSWTPTLNKRRVEAGENPGP